MPGWFLNSFIISGQVDNWQVTFDKCFMLGIITILALL